MEKISALISFGGIADDEAAALCGGRPSPCCGISNASGLVDFQIIFESLKLQASTSAEGNTVSLHTTAPASVSQNSTPDG